MSSAPFSKALPALGGRSLPSQPAPVYKLSEILSSYLISNVSIFTQYFTDVFFRLPGGFSLLLAVKSTTAASPTIQPQSPDSPHSLPVSFLSPSVPFLLPAASQPHVRFVTWRSCHHPAAGESCDTLTMNSPISLDSEESLIRRLLLGFATVLIFAALNGTLLAALPPQKSQTKELATKAKTSSPAKPADPASALTTISVDGVNDIDPAKAFGSKNAPVVMEIFSDFQCPACRQLFIATTQKVMDNYVNTGKVYLIHRDFPLPMHAYSRVAASYSRAAAHIGRCEEVEQAIYPESGKVGNEWRYTGHRRRRPELRRNEKGASSGRGQDLRAPHRKGQTARPDGSGQPDSLHRPSHQVRPDLSRWLVMSATTY